VVVHKVHGIGGGRNPAVIPAKAGIHGQNESRLAPSLRRDDEEEWLK
jgi:hypothetical protein